MLHGVAVAQEISSPPRLTVVTYHFVRPIAAGPYPRLKGLEPERFEAQIDYILRRYVPVSAAQVVRAATGEGSLPDRAVLLTFDDGYTDHVRYVLPVMRSWNISALFFPVAQSLLERRVLEVNKIQFVLAVADIAGVVAAVEQDVDEARSRFALRSADEYRTTWWKASRFDGPEVVFVKRMLQIALPGELRTQIVDRLFRTYVTADETSFANELYLSIGDAKKMLDAGMTIGPHGDRHVRLSTLSRDAQADEIDGALRILDVLALPRRGFCYCYANGDRNADSEALLASRGCAAAFTTEPHVAVLAADRRLSLPRLDTNDIPCDVV